MTKQEINEYLAKNLFEQQIEVGTVFCCEQSKDKALHNGILQLKDGKCIFCGHLEILYKSKPAMIDYVENYQQVLKKLLDDMCVELKISKDHDAEYYLNDKYVYFIHLHYKDANNEWDYYSIDKECLGEAICEVAVAYLKRKHTST